MDQKLLLKTTLALLAVGIMLALFFIMGRLAFSGSKSDAPDAPSRATPDSPAVTPVAAPALDPGLVEIPPSPTAGNQVAEKLRSAKSDIDKAVQAMAGATKNNHGGFVEKAQAELDRTSKDIADAITFAQDHPEINALPGAATPEALAAAEHAKAFTIANPGNQGHLVNGIAALQDALASLQEAKGGNIGGNRDKLLLDIDRSATAIMDGFQYLRNNPAPARGQNGGAAPTPAPGPPPQPTMPPP